MTAHEAATEIWDRISAHMGVTYEPGYHAMPPDYAVEIIQRCLSADRSQTTERMRALAQKWDAHDGSEYDTEYAKDARRILRRCADELLSLCDEVKP